jgi:hypothetical protein
MADPDQCVLLVKKGLPLVPEYFRTHYQSEMKAFKHIR